ncbi:hypothetical protein Bbelb_050030 [Branchiostoma belcheri]|nr:hypothetical protein Bbelb_050030 [Branchiostoma belcheri]
MEERKVKIEVGNVKKLEALEKAHRTEGVTVREALEQVLDLAKAPSHLNHALLIPAVRRLEEKARAAGHADYPTYAATLRHATLHERNSMLGEIVFRALGSDVDERIGSKFAKVVKQSGYHTQPVWPPPPPPPQWFPRAGVLYCVQSPTSLERPTELPDTCTGT